MRSLHKNNILKIKSSFSEKRSFFSADEEELVTVECPNCGSHTNIRKGEQQECAYCGTILKGE